MKKIVSVVGARPNFMKLAPISRALQPYSEWIRHIVVHTGQHYDYNMSDQFFEDLQIPAPDVFLGVGSGSHGEQTGRILIECERVLQQLHPDLVIVVGDVNSTIAGALAAKKLHIPVAHVEAGLRSFDRSMPEEINRIATDAIADYAFVTEQSGIRNLLREGWSEDRIFFVGNPMIDSLLFALPNIQKREILQQFQLHPRGYVVVTLHRPSNVDDPEQLVRLLRVLQKLAEHRVVVFPMHPRTRIRVEQLGLLQDIASQSLLVVEPFGYLDFIALVASADFVLTDSGGIQEETTVLKVPCVTLRTTTERPVTVKMGTNILVDPYNEQKILSVINDLLAGKKKQGDIPPLWDGKAGERITRIILHDIFQLTDQVKQKSVEVR